MNCITTVQIAKLSGTSAGSYVCSSGFMQVLFTSDSGVALAGFTASWSSVGSTLVRHTRYGSVCDHAIEYIVSVA